MKSTSAKQKFRGIFLSFRKRREGIAAVEFALIVPILLGLYLGTVEIANGITVNKRIARVASTVGDLASQVDSLERSDIDAIFDIGAAVMLPYQLSDPDIMIVGINVDTSYPQGGKVAWSRQLKSGSYSKPLTVNDDITVPTRLQIDGTFVLKVVSEIEYRPVATWVIGEKTAQDGSKYTALDMKEEYWLRPRSGTTLSCSDC